ncbi:MAG: Ig-like domain-containing protein [Chloroflexota bacterium]
MRKRHAIRLLKKLISISLAVILPLGLIVSVEAKRIVELDVEGTTARLSSQLTIPDDKSFADNIPSNAIQQRTNQPQFSIHQRIGSLHTKSDADQLRPNLNPQVPINALAGFGSFIPHSTTPSFGNADSIGLAVGDLNNDQALDLVVAKPDNRSQRVWLNQGDGTFIPHPNKASFGGKDSTAVVLGDLDGDDDLDIVVANHNDQGERVWLNNGAGIFSPHPTKPRFGSGSSTDIVLGDLDGDDDLDAIVSNDFGQPDTVWLNDGKGKFRPHPTKSELGQEISTNLALGDLDGDTDLDVFVSTISGENMIWLNDGNGVFTPHPTKAGFGSGFNHDVILGNLDGDSDLDAILLTALNKNEVWLNDGNGLFTAPETSVNFGKIPHKRAVLGDIDLDQDLDLVIANNHQQAQTAWLNDGSGQFIPHPLTPSFGSGNSYDIALADIDRDDDLDAIVANLNDVGQTVWVNEGQATADLQISKAVSSDVVVPGDTLTFTLSYTNAGPHWARNVQLVDLVPVGLTVSTIQSSRLITDVGLQPFTWQVDDLAPNDQGTIIIETVVDPLSPNKTITNNVSITATTFDFDFSNNADSVQVAIVRPSLIGATATHNILEDTVLNTVLPTPTSSSDGVIYELVTNATHGTVSINEASTGQFTYTPPPDFFGTDHFTYQLSDNVRSSEPATITINVLAVNDAPAFTASLIPIVDEDTGPHSLAGWATFDPGAANETDQLANYQVSNLDTPSLFDQTPQVDDAGTLTYRLKPNAFGTATFLLSVQDSGGKDDGGQDSSSSQQFTIIVNAVNDAPIAEDDTTTAEANVPIQLSVLDNDSDPDGDSLSIIAFTQPLNGIVASNGFAIQYTANANFNGSDAFNYTISDGTLTDVATVTVAVSFTDKIAPENSPVAVADIATTAEDTEIIIDVLANDNDPNNDILSVVAVTSAQHGAVLLIDGSVIYSPTINFYGQDQFSYTITDGSQHAEATVTVDVTAVNDAPLAASDFFIVEEDAQTTLAILDNDEDPDGDNIVLWEFSKPPHGMAFLQGGSFIYRANPDYHGIDSLSYVISDGELTSTATVSLTIQPVNDIPSFNEAPLMIRVEASQSFVQAITVTDPDVDDTVTISILNQPAWVTFTPTPNRTATLSGNPSITNVGQHVIQLQAEDGQMSQTQNVTITVYGPGGLEPTDGNLYLPIVASMSGDSSITLSSGAESRPDSHYYLPLIIRK